MAVIEILDGGVASTVQDRGRPGYRHLGVALSGALDPLWLACANALVGNGFDVPALEMHGRGPRLRVRGGALRLALAGQVAARRQQADGATLPLPAWRSATLLDGDTLEVGPVRGGVAYLALAGGIELPAQLGSRSTHLRAQLGGLAGRALRAGDRLDAGAALEPPDTELMGPAAFDHGAGPIRVLLGPQDDHFSGEALRALAAAEYRVGREADRMGMRLAGPGLAHRPEVGGEIISDAVTPGAIQVPPDGQPIVLLADCQTVGGYPKIATVIRADLPRLAHLLPGDRLRFSVVPRAEALAALRAQAAALDAWRAAIASFRPAGAIDEQALYGANLISGVVFENERFPEEPA